MASDKNSQYLISVIIPVYNVREYLDECVQSVIDQDVGFQKNIELILVNDGSTDGSDAICKKYASLYSNVVAIDKDNGGVSSARNAGLKVASSMFVAFFDADDKLASNFYSLLLEQLDKHKDLPFAVGRTKKFDAEDGYHATDAKFHKTRVIDLSKTPYEIQTLQSPALYRRSALEGIYFNELMTHSEDSEFVNRVLMTSQGRYAVVREAVYYYRRRKDESSATGVSKQRKTYYLSMVILVDSLLSFAERELSGAVPRFVQFALLYQVGWRMRVSRRPDALSDKEWLEYKESIKRAIYALDDDVIARGGPSVKAKERRLIFAVKLANSSEDSGEKLELSDRNISKMRKELVFCVHSLDLEQDKIRVSASTLPCSPQSLGLDLIVSINGERVDINSGMHTRHFMGDDIETETGTNFTLPIAESGVIAVAVADGSKSSSVPIMYSSSIGIKKGLLAYRRLSDDCFVLCDRYSLFISNGFNLQVVRVAGSMILRQTAFRGFSFIRRTLSKVYSFAK